jgi:predicted phage terminase large subunit-like protein
MEPRTIDIKLHRAQQLFCNSTALYRGFAAGISSGKSWVGCHDLIARSKAGRLYMVIGPTYDVLNTSTFRMFEKVAIEMGVADYGDIKKSAPPEVRLKTGATVLFRSADDPDRLRGANLTGCFLDEASLMPKEVFDVAIGRLRENGEQGWLSAAFTPKGKGHWTFEQFATNKADTVLFTSRTGDNPFNPPQFHETLAKQYTSQMVAQELEGLFIDPGSSLFRRSWFPIVDKLPATIGRCRAWDLAGTSIDEKDGKRADFTAGVLLCKGIDGVLYVADVRRFKETPQGVESIIRQVAAEDGVGVPIYMEQEVGSAGKNNISHYARHVLPGYNFRGVRSTGSKEIRAQPVAAMAEQGLIKLVRGNWLTNFLDEIEGFPFGQHDDQIDALSLAHSKIALCSNYASEGPCVLVPGRRDVYRDDGSLGFASFGSDTTCGAKSQRDDAPYFPPSGYRPSPF